MGARNDYRLDKSGKKLCLYEFVQIVPNSHTRGKRGPLIHRNIVGRFETYPQDRRRGGEYTEENLLALSPQSGDNAWMSIPAMHEHTKITPVVRREIFARWRKEKLSLRKLGEEYHVDKKVIQRIIERGAEGDFSIHRSVNLRYLDKSPKKKKKTAKMNRRKKSDQQGKTKDFLRTTGKEISRRLYDAKSRTILTT
jgi:hypothetical protein